MVSKHVAGLEAEVGVKMLSRTTRQLSLTEAGLTLKQDSDHPVRLAGDRRAGHPGLDHQPPRYDYLSRHGT